MSGGGARAHAGALPGRAPPFGLFERSVGKRYLMAKRAHGGVALISVISFLGVMFAVAVLIVVMSVMNGFRQELLGQLLGAQGHIFVEEIADQSAVGDLTAEIAAVPGVVRAAPMIGDQAVVSADEQLSVVDAFGLEKADLESLTTVREGLISGGMESFGEGQGAYDVLIGQPLASRLGVWIGDPLRLYSPSTAGTMLGGLPRSATYYVGGIFYVGRPEVDDLFVYMPKDEARKLFGRGDAEADFIDVSLSDPDRIDAVRGQIEAIVGARGVVKDWRDRNESLASALNVERTVMSLILALLVLLATLTITAGLVMLAKNKSGDIAILRTVGATRGSILRIFFLIGAAIGAVGTAAGLILGLLFCYNIGAIQGGLQTMFGAIAPGAAAFFDGMPASVDPREVVMVGLLGVCLSCIAALPPAWNAARLDPVETLRYG